MATVAFGILGTAVAGPAGGFVGTLIGGAFDNYAVYPLLFPPPDQYGMRVDGVNISSGNLGSPLSWPLGPRVRTTVAVIWASELEEVESSGSVGKGGGGKSYQYDYYQSYALHLGDSTPQTITAMRKLFTNFDELYNDGDTPSYDSLTFYDGTQTTPDPFLESVIGDGLVPAYMGSCYIVIQRMFLGQTSNRSPNWGAQIEQGIDVSLGDILGWTLARAGFDASEYDTTGVSHCIRGVNFAGVVETRQALQVAIGTYGVSAQELDGKLVFFDTGVDVPVVVDGGDLADMEFPGMVLAEDFLGNVPSSVTVKYEDVDINNQPGSVPYYDPNQTDSAENSLVFQTPFVLTNSEADRIAKRLYWQARGERREVRFALPSKYMEVAAGDIVTVTRNGTPLEILVGSATYGANGMVAVEGVITWRDIYTQYAVGADDGYTSGDGFSDPPDLTGVLADLPAIRDRDATVVTYYWGGFRDDPAETFAGASLWVSADNTTYTQAASVSKELVSGITVSGPGRSSDLDFDTTNTIVVDVKNGHELSSTTDALAISRSANLCAIAGNGGWEIISFVNATDLGNGRYELSRLIRGRDATDWIMGKHESSGERFILLSAADNTLGRWVAGTRYLGRFYAKVVPTGEDEANVAGSLYVLTGQSVRPGRPRNLRYEIINNGVSDIDLRFNWARRSKLAFEPFSVDAPIAGDESGFHLRIRFNGVESTVLREAWVDGEEFVYTQAMRDADAATGPGWWTEDDEFVIHIAGVSNVVGDGEFSNLYVPQRL